MMIFTNDIYRFIGDALSVDGYRDIRDVPISVIEEKIKEFLRMKIYTINEEFGITDLLTRLESYLDEHNKDKMMANFTFYILWYMSTLQGFEITWKIEDVDTPSFQDSDLYPGKIDALVTNKEINYISTFNFVLEEARKLYNIESRGR